MKISLVRITVPFSDLGCFLHDDLGLLMIFLGFNGKYRTFFRSLWLQIHTSVIPISPLLASILQDICSKLSSSKKTPLRLLMMTLMARFEVSYNLWLRATQGAVKRMWLNRGCRSFPARRWPRGSCGSSDPLPGRSALSSPAVALESSGRQRNRSGSGATTI